MKKILFMVSSMNIGGVEKSLISLLSSIPKDKYDITVLMLEKKGGFLEFLPKWVKVEEVDWFEKIKPIIMQAPQKTIKNYIENKNFLEMLLFTKAYFISKYFKNRYVYYKNIFRNVKSTNSEYDIAIAYAGPTDIIDFYIANKVKAKNKVSWIHFDIDKYKINVKLYEKLYEKFNKIFIVSKGAQESLNKFIPITNDKSEVFLNIISQDLIKSMANEYIEFDNEFKGTKILTVGRLSEEKGQDIAIKTLEKLKKEGYDVRWYCIGEGNDREKYEKLINKLNLKNDFILLGAKTNPYPYIKQCDIYVQTSRHEGYCLTLAEAKILNKPIITTKFLGAYEQIEDGKNGFIVNLNEKEIYNKIKHLIENKKEKKQLSDNLLKQNLDTKKEINKLFTYID